MAGSRNAFASSYAPPSGVLTEQDDNARPPKRPKLAENAVASIQSQSAQLDTSQEVDVMILDYVTYHAIHACLARGNNLDDTSSSLSRALTISNSFIAIFKARHQTYEPDAELRFRVLLLKLVTLFTQRLTSNPCTPAQSDLLALRTSNQERARAWMENADRMPSSDIDFSEHSHAFPLPLEQLERNRARVLDMLDIPAEDEDYEDAFYGTSACVSLLDVLPIFMQVSSARNAMSDSSMTERWMQFACEFMLQACLEQFLVFGKQGSHVIDEVFAWGYLYAQHETAGRGEERVTKNDINAEVNTMFEDDEYTAEVETWNDMKLACLKNTFPPSARGPSNAGSLFGSNEEARNIGVDIVPYLEALAVEHPIGSFQTSVLKFLEDLSKSLPDPVLVQLEQGKLDGMTELETQEFLLDCGIGTANFFVAPIGFKVAD